MGYDRSDFKEIRQALRSALLVDDNEPIACQLHEALESPGRVELQHELLSETIDHVAEACNIAELISSTDRLLSLPRSNVACSDLSDLLILNLDLMREYIRASYRGRQNLTYMETEADSVIRRWAGFIKHPQEFVFAHKCLSDLVVHFDQEVVQIDSEFLSLWDGLTNAEKDRNKRALANCFVSIQIPRVEAIQDFFHSSSVHLKRLINSGLKPNAQVPSH